jgi:ribosome-associated protein
METIEINSDVIQLDQLLKWAGIVDSGGQVRFMLDEKIIKMNDVFLTERRKKVYPGDVVEIVGTGTWKVVKSQGE